MLGSKGLIFVVFLCDKNGIIVLSFSGRMSHRRLAVSSTPYDIGIERQKDNPMLKTHKIALDPNNVQATQFAQHYGYARVAYNHALADFNKD